MITDKEALKQESIKYLGGYPSKTVANKFLLFKSPRKGLKKKKAVSVTIRIPLANSEQKNKTRTIEHSGQSTHAFLDLVRTERDSLFKEVHCLKYTESSLMNVTPPRKKQESVSGVDGVGVVKNTLKFKVNYELMGTNKTAYFSVLSSGSEDTSFVEACRFNDEINGRTVKDDSTYLKQKKQSIFPCLNDADAFWLHVEKLEAVKSSKKVNKSGVEVVAKVGMLGFFANFYNAQQEQQYRHFFNAVTMGEDAAYLEACQAKDEIDGKPLMSDSEYLKLKPDTVFDGLI